MPTKRNFSSLLSDSQDPSEHSYSAMGSPALLNKNKKLRRLPHVFSKVLELPFNSDADVSIEERPDCFRFVAKDGFLGGGGRVDVRAHMIEVHPGVKKVVVKRNGGKVGKLLLIDELELDMWRFRLPANSLPEAAKAVCSGGELVVTVPKNGGGGREKAARGNMGNLVAVQ